ncbi:recombinase family protein [Paenibacillus sp. JSM ZJ436]|uniref:recombinase family protein n=1 Tax=Paenibacillus sp. JSM ZJ436 TaxID=3376190 RepID=UPI0037ABB256
MSILIEHAVLHVRSASHSKESLDPQRVKGQNYAKQHSLQLSIIEDPHASGIGLLENRSGLRWLKHLVEVGLIKSIIVDSSYRISRITLDLFHFKLFLDNHGAKLIALDLLDRGGLNG